MNSDLIIASVQNFSIEFAGWLIKICGERKINLTNINKEQLQVLVIEYWNLSTTITSSTEVKKVSIEKSEKSVSKKVLPAKDADSDVENVEVETQNNKNGCKYLITRGANANKMCSKNVKPSFEYCTQHQKQIDSKESPSKETPSKEPKEGKIAKEPKESKDTKVVKNKDKAETLISKVVNNHINAIKDPKSGVFFNKETGFIINQYSRKVTGKLIGEKVHQLTAEDKKECNKRKLEFDDGTSKDEEPVLEEDDLDDDEIIDDDDDDEIVIEDDDE